LRKKLVLIIALLHTLPFAAQSRNHQDIIMKTTVFGRAGAQSLRSASLASQRMSMGTLATFKTPKVANEPNVRFPSVMIVNGHAC
jgi:hypothetical protein